MDNGKAQKRRRQHVGSAKAQREKDVMEPVPSRGLPRLWWANYLVTITICTIISAFIFAGGRQDGWQDPVVVLIATVLGVVQGTVIYVPVLGVQILVERARRRRSRLEVELRELQEQMDVDFFTNLVRINFKYIDKYYLQTQIQADKSFWLSVGAAAFSFLIVAVGIVLLFMHVLEPGYVTLAAGTLGEFNATVCFYLYNRTIREMGDYHQKLVLTQNISLALRIAEKLEGDAKVQAQACLIESLCKDVNYLLSVGPDHVPEREKTKAGSVAPAPAV